MGSRMPTNTRFPSLISRDATATINSWSVYASAIANAQRLDVDTGQISRSVGHLQHPLLEPRLEPVASPRRSCVLAVEGVVAVEIPLHRRRVRAARFMD